MAFIEPMLGNKPTITDLLYCQLTDWEKINLTENSSHNFHINLKCCLKIAATLSGPQCVKLPLWNGLISYWPTDIVDKWVRSQGCVTKGGEKAINPLKWKKFCYQVAESNIWWLLTDTNKCLIWQIVTIHFSKYIIHDISLIASLPLQVSIVWHF